MMANEHRSAACTNSAPLRPTQIVGRLAAMAALLGAVAGSFVYFGGWLTPSDLTPTKFADVFQAVDGVHRGFRRNHAKGICVSGYFESNGNGAALSKAAVFQSGRAEVVGRFSLAGGMPFQADKPGQIRGLGLQLTTPDGQIWRTAMVNLPVFPVNTPQAFYDRMLTLAPDPATGKPDPAKMAAFLATHPETVAAIQIIKSHPPSPGFGDSEYHSLNAFMFSDAQGKTTPVRWVFAPDKSTPAQPVKADDPNYLFEALIAQIHRQPLQWHLMLIVGQPGDPTNDATLPWPDSRQQIDAGTLMIDRIQSEDSSPIASLNFDPLVLPDGIAPSDDPLLGARSAVYSVSFTRRSGEQKTPSAMTPADVDGSKQ
jgi:catalase